MKTFKQDFQKLHDVYYRLNEERFKLIAHKAKMDYKEADGLYRCFCNGGLHSFIEKASDKFLKEMVKFHHNLENSWKCSHVDTHKNLVKFIYEIDEKPHFQELDMSEYEGNKCACLIYETADKILTIARLCDTINAPHVKEKQIHIYEGDIIKVKDQFRDETKMIVAFRDEGHIHEPPYYKELIYSTKYGYLSKNGDPNEDSECIQVKESIFETKDKTYNSYVITLGSHYEVLGNVATHLHLLMPDKQLTK